VTGVVAEVDGVVEEVDRVVEGADRVVEGADRVVEGAARVVAEVDVAEVDVARRCTSVVILLSARASTVSITRPSPAESRCNRSSRSISPRSVATAVRALLGSCAAAAARIAPTSRRSRAASPCASGRPPADVPPQPAIIIAAARMPAAILISTSVTRSRETRRPQPRARAESRRSWRGQTGITPPRRQSMRS
jgi:hypothetical protein